MDTTQASVTFFQTLLSLSKATFLDDCAVGKNNKIHLNSLKKNSIEIMFLSVVTCLPYLYKMVEN